MFHALTFAIYTSRDDHWVWASLGVCAGIYLFLHGFRILQRKRLILNTPASKVRSASMGLVEISGLAAGPYTLTAPITGLPCYYYQTKVWQLKQSGKKNEWDLVADECLHVPFFLDDNTGRVLVDPQGADLDIHRDFHEEFDFSIPANVAGFLQRHQVDTTKRIKVDEYCIKPKNSLFVCGTLAENPGLEVTPTPVPSFPGNLGTFRINLSGSMQDGLLKTFNLPGVATTTVTTISTTRKEGGLPETTRTSTYVRGGQPGKTVSPELIAEAMKKAGITNPAAWEAVGLQAPGAAVPAAATTADAGEFDLHPKTVLMKGEHNPLFMISWRSQRQIVASLGWKSALMIWGGPALTLLCSYFVLAHFGLL